MLVIWVETLASMISSGVSTMQVPPSSSPMGMIFTCWLRAPSAVVRAGEIFAIPLVSQPEM